MNADEQKMWEYVHARWTDMKPMAVGRFDIFDMEGQMDVKAAYEFTEQREREIAEVEEEIALVAKVATLIAGGTRARDALARALRAIDAFWPADPPENEGQAEENRAIAGVRKRGRAALKAWEDTKS